MNNDMVRKNISSGSPWEGTIGYSRAVRIGNIVEVSGTTAMDGDKLVGEGDIYAQTKFILQKIEAALTEAGASLAQVIRTRIFTTDISQWEKIGNAHGEMFGNIKPATTMVEVAKLIDAKHLVEIEASAIISL